MKGKLLEVTTLVDEFHNESYQITVFFDTKPKFKLGDVEVKQ